MTSRITKVLALISALFISLFAYAASTAQTQPVLIYADGLKNGWWIGGWSTQTPEFTLEDQRPIQITMKGWNAFTLQTSQPVKASDYSVITVVVHGGEKGKQEMKVRAKLGEKNYDGNVTIKATKGQWVRYDIRIKDLKIKDGQFDTIELRNDSAEEMPPYYINYVLLQ